MTLPEEPTKPDYSRWTLRRLQKELEDVKSRLAVLKREFPTNEGWLTRALLNGPEWSGWNDADIPDHLRERRRLDIERRGIALELSKKERSRAGKSPTRTKKTPQQTPTRTKRRATTVSRLLRELQTIKPKMHNEGAYGQVKRGLPKYLIFQVAEKDSEVRTWIENVQDRRGLVGLAQEIAARHYRMAVATIKTDWSHRKKPRQSPRKPLQP